MVSYCAGCNGKIHDKFLMKVLDKTWHSECLVCVDCGAVLADQCFTRNGKFYCNKDFEKNQGSMCGSCKKEISPDDMILKPPNTGGMFHVTCFTCSRCRRQLEAGEEFYTIADNKFMCSHDYKNSRTKASKPDNEVHSTTGDVKPAVLPTTCTQATTISEYPTPSATCTPWTSPPSSHLSPHQHSPPNSLLSPHQHSPPSSLLSPHQHSPPNSLLSPHQHSPPSSLLSPHQHSPPISLLPPHQHSPAPGVVSTTVQDHHSPGLHHKQEAMDECGVTSKIKQEPGESCSEAVNSPETSNSQVSTTTGKRRGPRTTIKSKQLDILKAAFKSNQKPTRNIREQLATETGLNMRVIQVWFQNRRSKERRMTQMKLANRGRYGNPLARDDEFGFQDHYYRNPAECYYGDLHHHQAGYMQCPPLPGMEQAATRSLDHHDPWARAPHPYDPTLNPQHHGLMGTAGYQTTTGHSSSWQGTISPDSTNQIAFQT